MRFNSRPRFARLLASVALAGLLAVSAAGCASVSPETTGSINSPDTPRTDADWRKALAEWGPRYHADNSDPKAAMYYAQALRATGQRAQAVAVLQQASLRNPRDMQLLGEYGRALADAGDYTQALAVLDHAQTPDNPDWRILNVQGAVLDQMGRHQEAQQHYSSALKIVPNEPSILSNLGLSYALSRNLPMAEKTLRLAAAQPKASPKVRQNLALVIGLQGRFKEAERIASADLPPDQAAANVAYLRTVLAQQTQGKKRGRLHLPPPATSS
jgi:Flp pilus assembly protein TadD